MTTWTWQDEGYEAAHERRGESLCTLGDDCFATPERCPSARRTTCNRGARCGGEQPGPAGQFVVSQRFDDGGATAGYVRVEGDRADAVIRNRSARASSSKSRVPRGIDTSLGT